MRMIKTFCIVFLLTISYFILFRINDYLFSSYIFSERVSWIFLPSGLRLVFVLVFIDIGAISIGLSSIAISYLYFSNVDLITVVGMGVVSGFAPWLARKICIRLFKLDPNLQNLSSSALLKVAVIFAVVSPVMHQAWFVLRGQTESFVQNTVAMAIGDLLGTLLVLYFIKFLMSGVYGLTNKSYNKPWLS